MDTLDVYTTGGRGFIVNGCNAVVVNVAGTDDARNVTGNDGLADVDALLTFRTIVFCPILPIAHNKIDKVGAWRKKFFARP